MKKHMRIRELGKDEFPRQLLEIPGAPKKLYIEGNLPPPDIVLLCVVGARTYTEYGKRTCQKLIAALAGKNVGIVSGLALGIDSIAHHAALEHGLYTLALPGSGLDRKVLHPHSNIALAERIVASGGGLLAEFESDFKATQWSFPQRNRIMAGLSQAVLIIEAAKKSGTLITARLGTEYNRDVLAVPGSIYSENSEGPHLLIRLGATPITCPDDLLEALHFPRLDETEGSHDPNDLKNNNRKLFDDCSPEEKKVLLILQEPLPKDDLIRRLEIPASEVNILLSVLEMKGHILEKMGRLQLALPNI